MDVLPLLFSIIVIDFLSLAQSFTSYIEQYFAKYISICTLWVMVIFIERYPKYKMVASTYHVLHRILTMPVRRSYVEIGLIESRAKGLELATEQKFILLFLIIDIFRLPL